MQTSAPAPAPAATGKAPSARDLFVADMAAMRAPSAPAPAKDAEPAAPSDDDIPVDPLALADGGDPEADDPEATAAAVLAAAKDAPAPPKDEQLDPAQAKRIEAAQRDERRRKDALKAEREALRAEADAERAKIEEQRGSVAAAAKAAKEFDALKARAAADPMAAIELLRSLGYDDNAFAAVSHAAWGETPKGREDPRHKENAAKLARDREVGGGLAEMRKEIADLKASLESRDRSAATERAVNGYLDAAMEVAATGKVVEVDDEGNEIVAATVEEQVLDAFGLLAESHPRGQLRVVVPALGTHAADVEGDHRAGELGDLGLRDRAGILGLDDHERECTAVKG